MNTRFIEVITTCDSKSEAEKIAEELVGRRACACVQITGPGLSIYRWKGRVERSEEWYCRAKTSAGLLKETEKIIKSLHSYELPEIVARPLIGGSTDYLSWIEEETGR